MKILDLFCGAGGASAGMSEFAEITGVDISEQPEYPFQFALEDATKVKLSFLRKFDLVWASPPCQRYSSCTPSENKKKHPDLVDVVRQKLIRSKIPFVIENVIPAPVRKDLVLCGEMFGLKVIRHRAFEIHGFSAMQPKHKEHKGCTCQEAFKRGHPKKYYYESVHGKGSGANLVDRWQKAMGIDWMTKRKSLAESIPPAYSRYILQEFLAKRECQAMLF